MKRLLIITEDVVKIQTLSGKLGRFYAKGYIFWLKLRLRLVQLLFSPFYQVRTLVTNDIGIGGPDNFYYGDELSQVDYAKERDKYWRIINRLKKTINFNHGAISLFDLLATKLTVYLVYHYFIYEQIFIRLYHGFRPDKVLVLGRSHHESTAVCMAKLQKIPVKELAWLSLSWLQIWLQNFLMRREYDIKIKNFKMQALRKQSKLFGRPVLLSADFYRHLKTLIPLYRRLESGGETPILVTDVNNLRPTLKNLYEHEIDPLFLAGFFGKRPWPQPVRIEWDKLAPAEIKTMDDWFYHLSLIVARPMIIRLLWLSRIYLLAADNLFRQLKPKGVMVVSDVRLVELALALTAKKYRVPTILVSPNTMVDLAAINPYQSANKVAVVGDYIKSQLETLGVPAKKISIAGDLVKENIADKHPLINKRRVCQILGIEAAKKIALLISFRPTWMIPREEKRSFIKMAVQASKAAPDLVLVVKPHPTEKRYRLLEELKDWGLNGVVVSDNDQVSLLDLIHASSVVLQTWSFTVFEAIMLNRPVVVINPYGKNYNYFLPIIHPGGAVEVTDLQSLINWLKILINPHHQKTISQLRRARRASDQFIHFSQGEASGKVISLLGGKFSRFNPGGNRS